jgi:hypothetical protein
MSSTCGITSQYSNVISDRFINNNAVVYNMQRLSSVYTMVPDGHFLSWSNIPTESRNRLNSDVANEIDFGRNIQEEEEEKKGE